MGVLSRGKQSVKIRPPSVLAKPKPEQPATNKCCKLIMTAQNVAGGFTIAGAPLSDNSKATTVYNDNEVCISWSNNITMKNIRHMELHDNSVHEWFHGKSLRISHVAGNYNPNDISTKEMKDGANFRCIRDSFICHLSNFLEESLAGSFQLRQVNPEVE